jgi:transposase
MNRLERTGETLRAAVNRLAVAAAEWLKVVAEPEWFKRYGSRIENLNLPKTDAGRIQLAATIGWDGKELLRSIEASDARLQLASLAPVLLLQRV